MNDFPWQLAQNLGSTGLMVFVIYRLFERWLPPMLLALKDHTTATAQQAAAVTSLAATIKESQSDQREVLIAVRVLSKQIDDLGKRLPQ